MKYRFSTKFIVLFFLLSSVFALANLIGPASLVWGNPDPVADLKQRIFGKEKEIEALEKEAEAYRGTLEQNYTEQKTLKSQLGQIDKELKNVNYNISITQKKLEATQLKIEELGDSITETQEGIGSNSDQLAELLNMVNEIDTKSQLTVFLSIDKFSEFFGEVAYLDNVQEKILEKMNFLRVLKNTLETDLTASEQTKKQYVNLQGSLSVQKEIAEDKKTEKESVLSETKNQEKQYQKLLDDTIAKQQQIEKDINSLETELRKYIDFDKIPRKQIGLFTLPLPGGHLTQEYGEVPRGSITRKYYSFHNGLDFGSKLGIGAPIVAADLGTVKAIGNNGKYAYGKWVAIEHPYGLTTLYAHLSYIGVGVGQTVQRGQVIGNMGKTGLALGPHLHFTVYTTDSFKTEKRWFGLLPLGASVNPNDYL
jgi:murein DD-endopeptidase MepM/ murein hydrolase activator NlpD